jgi:hypothetical protein
MNAFATAPATFKTFLSPGQKYASSDLISSLGSNEVTVARLVRDRLGLMHVTLRTDDGREISAFVEQIEAAIAAGNLQPVEAGLVGVAC